MPRQDAKNFFDKLVADDNLKATVKQKIEDIAKDAGYPNASEKDLTDELAARWKADPNNVKIVYSEPPGF
jgi:hypothetical protein